MGQFVFLPDGTMWMGNGVGMGTAGYGDNQYSVGRECASDAGEDTLMTAQRLSVKIPYTYLQYTTGLPPWAHGGIGRACLLPATSACTIPQLSFYPIAVSWSPGPIQTRISQTNNGDHVPTQRNGIRGSTTWRVLRIPVSQPVSHMVVLHSISYSRA